MTQRAGLLFPDLVLSDAFSKVWSAPVGKTWSGPRCVENLAKSSAVQAYYFHHDSKNRAMLDLDPVTVFPEDDPLRLLLSRAVWSLAGFGGAVPIWFGPGGAIFPWEADKLPR
jgi:hypothetical protein